ncbi:uncharacterized protein LOC126968315 [Leptidea sinapis]|uniref:uncharacterized protein LOC126968315 n=1 Tax=Leptidea sinapis TaxID=189913 RepID=UPI00213B6BC4|nr:uncharacterized protein LOC126968315 [Leptidea sinapis]
MSRDPVLSSIPEHKESEEVIKWVPKKKHEVLKAKYKCLKKLFQIYDANVIGMLPETIPDEPIEQEEHKHRKRRSRRTKTDACAGTTEVSSGDVNDELDSSIPTVIKDLNSQVSQVIVRSSRTSIIKRNEYTQDSKENISVKSEKYSECSEDRYYIVNPRRKPTRFQCFLQRIFGIRRASYNYNTHGYAASDNHICNRYTKRRRHGLRFRRMKQSMKIHSEIALRDLKSPVIMTYVQSVQRNCLADTTPRQCPFLGCNTMLYGIINYNDHLNLCHFPERRYVCHYCHEGFLTEEERFSHENEHLGIPKLKPSVVTTAPSEGSSKITCVTQTDPEIPKSDVPEDKLKKIVSFFDKLTNEHAVVEVKKNRSCEYTTDTGSKSSSDSQNESVPRRYNNDSVKVSSCVQFHRKSRMSSDESDLTSFLCDSPKRCQLCGEKFMHRHQLNLHVDLHHRANQRFSKFHSCAGIVNTERTVVESSCASNTTMELSCDQSTNIVYYTSVESINRSVESSVGYKWEPGTKIIRV